jgi:hypothetical protein
MADALQIEFPLAVAVCAWCRPVKRRDGSALDSQGISHGICPRHFRKLERELKGIVLKRRSRTRAGFLAGEPLLAL